MNVIIGADDGKFVVTFMLRPKSVKKKFPSDKPELVMPWIRKMVKKHGDVDNLMFGSSMDFPEEYGVTDGQVLKLSDELRST